MSTTGQQKRLTSIVAIDRNGAIGTQNALPWKLKSDMAFFKSTTQKNTVIMGRKTYESIGGCLPDRMNIVLSHNFDLFPSTEKCRIALSLPEALHLAEHNRTHEIFVIGGAMTYQEFAPLVDRYLVTVVDHTVPDADAFLDQSILDGFQNWKRNEIATYPAVPEKDQYAFSVYEIIPDNIRERREERLKLVRKFAEQVKSKPHRSPSLRQPPLGNQQLSFI